MRRYVEGRHGAWSWLNWRRLGLSIADAVNAMNLCRLVLCGFCFKYQKITFC